VWLFLIAAGGEYGATASTRVDSVPDSTPDSTRMEDKWSGDAYPAPTLRISVLGPLILYSPSG